MKWIVKSGEWYLDDVGWFKPQKMARRFGTRKAAQEAADQILYEGFDARVVNLVPKTDDWFVRFADRPEAYIVDPYVDEKGLPNCKRIAALPEATLFDEEAAELFAAAWNAVMSRGGYPDSDWLEAVRA